MLLAPAGEIPAGVAIGSAEWAHAQVNIDRQGQIARMAPQAGQSLLDGVPAIGYD